MKFKKSLLGSMVSLAMTTTVMSAGAIAQEITIGDTSLLKAATDVAAQASSKKSGNLYIVQMKGAAGISHASDIGELTPSNQLVALGRNNYNANTPAMEAYTQTLRAKQQSIASEIGELEILHSYAHTFNGFSAKLSDKQVAALRAHPDVAGVYQDEAQAPTTANTPAFLGLTGEGGQHTLDIKGEDVIVGILDTGIWPENPSFADDGSFGDPAELGWQGECNVGTVGEFTNDADEVVYNDASFEPEEGFECNNKHIGARYFGASFSSTYEIRFDLGEFASPRDADGHGSHTAGTSAGNEGVAGSVSGFDAGTLSGIAPRARVATYKVCWNSDYVSPEGVNERGCFFGDSMAAIDAAVVDGVDVLNYSIGNSTAINSPVYNAALRAAEAGVFFAASAGNSGPGPETTSNIAPWIATVGASTYDGESLLVGDALEVTVDEVPQEPIFSIHGGITTVIPEEGFSGQLAIVSPSLACGDGIDNPEEIAGNIALIERGACNFSTKILNAQEAGATGVVVYSDNRTPTAMGGDATGIEIPGVMIERSTGLDIVDQMNEGAVVEVTMGYETASGFAIETGNVMAGFSSRGQNPQTGDIIKPDITAPGVQILAATSTDMLDIPGNVDGESFRYLSGTSMSGPHIAGMGALLMGQHPDWSPAAVKSALMTTAYQGVFKEDGTTPADPFDFGAGHANPVPAMAPGLVYDANFGDYLAFLCGQGEDALVASLSDTDCATLEADGFATDASQLNYPSISIGELDQPETITRTLTDVSGAGGDYTITIEAPEGIDVTVATFDGEGNETDSDNLVVEANGQASYALTFTKNENLVANEYVFGSITLTNTDGTTVRSPIAINAVPDRLIDVPESVGIVLNRGRGSFPVQTLYTGNTSMDYVGLQAPGGVQGTAVNKNQADFDFNTAIGDGTFHLFAVPEGTKVARWVLSEALLGENAEEGTDLDLHVWNCIAFRCNPVTTSENSGSNEEVTLVNPEPRSGAGGDLYVVAIHGWDLGDQDALDYIMPTYIVDGVETTTRMSMSRLAVDGRFSSVRLTTRGLQPGFLYLGAATFYNEEGEAEGTTVIEAVQPE